MLIYFSAMFHCHICAVAVLWVWACLVDPIGVFHMSVVTVVTLFLPGSLLKQSLVCAPWYRT